jgi:hypothetical protein
MSTELRSGISSSLVPERLRIRCAVVWRLPRPRSWGGWMNERISRTHSHSARFQNAGELLGLIVRTCYHHHDSIVEWRLLPSINLISLAML